MYKIQGRYATASIFNDLTAQNTVGQLLGICNELITKNTHVALMPDGHYGAGVPVGTTIRLPEDRNQWRISPTIISGDIGCGMLSVKIAEKNIDFDKLDKFITNKIPSGAEKNTDSKNEAFSRYTIDNMTFTPSKFDLDDVLHSLGSLGGGNHFIEMDRDKKGYLWLVIHCGSRHVGSAVLKAHMSVAKNHYGDEYLETLSAFYRAAGRDQELSAAIRNFKQTDILTNIDYAFLQGANIDNYLHDVKLAQDFAANNRKIIAEQIIRYMHFTEVDRFDTIHNYFDYDDNTIRKGATSAQNGKKLIIPLNMRDGSLICYGRGNEDWNYSAPHGAGRILSRSEAKDKLKMDMFKDEMKNVYTSSVDVTTIDEAPDAYKPMSQIIDNIGDTVRIVDRIKPVYNYKAH